MSLNESKSVFVGGESGMDSAMLAYGINEAKRETGQACLSIYAWLVCL